MLRRRGKPGLLCGARNLRRGRSRLRCSHGADGVRRCECGPQAPLCGCFPHSLIDGPRGIGTREAVPSLPRHDGGERDGREERRVQEPARTPCGPPRRCPSACCFPLKVGTRPPRPRSHGWRISLLLGQRGWKLSISLESPGYGFSWIGLPESPKRSGRSAVSKRSWVGHARLSWLRPTGRLRKMMRGVNRLGVWATQTIVIPSEPTDAR